MPHRWCLRRSRLGPCPARRDGVRIRQAVFLADFNISPNYRHESPSVARVDLGDLVCRTGDAFVRRILFRVGDPFVRCCQPFGSRVDLGIPARIFDRRRTSELRFCAASHTRFANATRELEMARDSRMSSLSVIFPQMYPVPCTEELVSCP